MSALTRFSMRNRALVALATLFAVLAGLWSTTSLPRELFPSLQFPVLAVTASSPGSSAAVVEERVTSPLEVAAQGLGNVVEVQSTSAEGLSFVTIELDYGTDLGAAQTQLQRSVLSLQGLPEGVDPQVFAGSIDDFPILQLAATGGEDAADLRSRLTTVVIPDIEDIDGVRDVQLTGLPEQVVRIELDEEAAAEAGVTGQTIGQALQANGVVVPAGTVLDGAEELPVQVGTRIGSVEDLRTLPLVPAAVPGGMPSPGAEAPAAPDGGQAEAPTAPEGGGAEAPTAPDGGQAEAPAAPGAETPAAPETPALPATTPAEPVLLQDVAAVELSERAATSFTRTNGEPSVGLAVTRTPEGNAVEISHALLALQPDLEAALGDGEITVVFDQAPFIEDSIEGLATEGGLGLVFAVLVVLVFLMSVRLTLVTAVSIPLSLLIAMIGLTVAGYSLNILTLGALTISVGRVVDDSIVVIENIRRHQQLGESRSEAVVNATKEVAGAITSATVATVAVFAPLALVGGQVGELFRPFALTIAIAMAASLFVALTIIPVLGYWFLRPGRSARAVRRRERAAERAASDEPDRLQRSFLPALHLALRRPAVTLLAAVVLLGVTGFGATFLKTNFIGAAGENTLSATLTTPTGSTLEDTDDQAGVVEQWLAEQDEIESYQVTVGSPGGIEAIFLGGGATTAQFSLTLDEGVDAGPFGDRMREEVALPEDSEITIAASAQSPVASSVEVVVSAQDTTLLAEAADQVTEAVRATGATDVTNNLTATRPALQVSVDREAAAALGMAEAQVGQAVAAAANGTTVGRLDLGTTPTEVLLVQGEAPQDRAALEELVVGAGPEGPVTVADVGTVERVDELVEITRIDGIRSATITGQPGSDNLGALTADLRERLDTLDLPDGVRAEIGGVSAEQQEAFASLGLALLAAIGIVYLVMVGTFNSLVQPLILMISIPFAATGSVAMLLVTDTPLDVASLIGVLMLVGIVVTNAIVLIDLVNQYRRRGLGLRPAVVEGARHRLRPIVMTALATVFALVPMALSVTGGGAFISQPLALVVIGGLVSSTALTLLLVPALYLLVEGRRERRRERLGLQEA